MKSFSILFLLKQFILIVCSFLLPIKGVLLTVGLCILLDTILGIYRSKKIKQKITSRKLSNIVSKMVLYQSSIILFFIIDKFILGDIIGIFTEVEYIMTKLIAITLISIELKSMNENYEVISGLSIWERFKKMLIRAKEVKKDLEDTKD